MAKSPVPVTKLQKIPRPTFVRHFPKPNFRENAVLTAHANAVGGKQVLRSRSQVNR